MEYPDQQQAMAACNEFAESAQNALRSRFEVWAPDYASIEVHEVVGALVARQVSLAKVLASSPALWSSESASLVIRPMVEVYITLAWIFESPVDRSKMFVKHGLGQMKLCVAHRKAQLANANEDERADLEQEIARKEEWINSQRWEFLTEVNLGNWAKTDLRKMAEEVGELDLYNASYTPLSAGVHSMWNHVGVFNLRQCQNPLHRFHKVPCVRSDSGDFQVLLVAGAHLDRTFHLFDRKTGTKCSEPSPLHNLAARLSKLVSPEGENS